MPAAEIGNDIGNARREGWLALASCDRNEATACAQDQREARRSNEPNKKGDRVGRLWLSRLFHAFGIGSCLFVCLENCQGFEAKNSTRQTLPNSKGAALVLSDDFSDGEKFHVSIGEGSERRAD